MNDIIISLEVNAMVIMIPIAIYHLNASDNIPISSSEDSISLSTSSTCICGRVFMDGSSGRMQESEENESSSLLQSLSRSIDFLQVRR